MHDTVLGAFQSDAGGKVFLNVSENLENGSLLDTLYHESCHAYMSKITVLGFLQNILLMEAACAENEEPAHSEVCTDCAKILHERTSDVHEIFANSMELLTIEETKGREAMLRALCSRPAEYQSFYMALAPVHQSGLSYREKRRDICALCAYALNGTVPPRAASNVSALSTCLQGEANPRRRLTEALSVYKENGTVPKDETDMEALWQAAAEAFPYVRPYFADAVQHFAENPSALSGEQMQEAFESHMLESVRLFEPSMLRPQRTQAPQESDVFLVLRHVQNLLSPETFYTISFEEEYLSREINARALQAYTESAASVCILYAEYDEKKKAPMDFTAGKTLLTVLLQTGSECDAWLKAAQKEDTVYVSELRAARQGAEVSLLFFAQRCCPQTVFVFPTLSALRERLLQKYGLCDVVCDADSPHFLKVFSHLGNEAKMLQYLKGLLPLLLGRTWEALMQSDMLRIFPALAGHAVMNTILQIKRNNHYAILAALPPKDTKAAPLYTLMRFEGNQNTGDTYADEKTGAPLLFPTKENADRFARQNAPHLEGVGIDAYFWSFFRQMVKERGGKVILALDEDGHFGKLADVNHVSVMFYNQV